MATTISNYSTFTPAVGTLTNPEGALRPDKGDASSNLLIGYFDILPQLGLPGNAIAPLTGLEVIVDDVRSSTSTTFLQLSIFSGSVNYTDKANHVNGNATVTTSPQTITFGSSSLAGGVWKNSSNVNLATGSKAIQIISSASSDTEKLKGQVFINSGGGNIVSFSNVRVRLTYTPATSPLTQYRRAEAVIENTAPIGGVGFLSPNNLLENEGGEATSNESGSILVLRYPNLSIPAGATVTGYELKGGVKNQGSASVYGTIDLDVQIGTGSTFGTINNYRLPEGNTSFTIGGDGNLQGLDLTPAEANDLSVKFTYKDTSLPTSSLALVGNPETVIPALRVYYLYTPASSYTRPVLRNGTTASEDFDGTDSVTFTLENNATTTAYFNIEGVNGKDIFNSASITNLISCSAVTESVHAGFVINPLSTGSFVFTPTTAGGINKEDIKFVASNRKVIYPTSSEFYGVDLDLT